MGSIHITQRLDPHLVAMFGGHAIAPGGELRARPLEAMIVMTEAARRQCREQHVVVGVGRGDDDGARTGIAEDRALHVTEAAGLDVLDDRAARQAGAGLATSPVD